MRVYAIQPVKLKTKSGDQIIPAGGCFDLPERKVAALVAQGVVRTTIDLVPFERGFNALTEFMAAVDPGFELYQVNRLELDPLFEQMDSAWNRFDREAFEKAVNKITEFYKNLKKEV